MRNRSRRTDAAFRRFWRPVGLVFDLAPDPPPAPDYTAAANAQGAANAEAIRLQTRLNRPTEVSPLGTRTWSGSGDNWTSTTKLSPQMAALFNTQANTSQALGNLGYSTIGRVRDAFGQEFPTDSLPGVEAPSEARRAALADALLGRAEGRFARDEETTATRLLNQGFAPGTEGYSEAMRPINEARVDARFAADSQAGNEMAREYAMQQQARDRAIQEAAYLRQLPLTELNSLRTGAQPQMPQFQAWSPTSAPQAAPLFAATQAQYGSALDAYNAQAAGTGNLMGGLFNLGSAYLMGG